MNESSMVYNLWMSGTKGLSPGHAVATVFSAHPPHKQTLGCAGLTFNRQVVEKGHEDEEHLIYLVPVSIVFIY